MWSSSSRRRPDVSSAAQANSGPQKTARIGGSATKSTTSITATNPESRMLSFEALPDVKRLKPIFKD